MYINYTVLRIYGQVHLVLCLWNEIESRESGSARETESTRDKYMYPTEKPSFWLFHWVTDSFFHFLTKSLD